MEECIVEVDEVSDQAWLEDSVGVVTIVGVLLIHVWLEESVGVVIAIIEEVLPKT